MYLNQKLVCQPPSLDLFLLWIDILDDMKDSNLHFSWHNVSVREYDSEKQRWRVVPDDREHNVFDMYRPAKRSRKQEAIETKRRSTENGFSNGEFSQSKKFIPAFSSRPQWS